MPSDFVVEAFARRSVPVYGVEPLSKPAFVVAGDVFHRDLDLPLIDETVTIICGKRIMRGRVEQIVFLCSENPADPGSVRD